MALNKTNIELFSDRYMSDARFIDNHLGITRCGLANALEDELDDASQGVQALFSLPTNPSVEAATKVLEPWLALPMPDRVTGSILYRYGRIKG